MPRNWLLHTKGLRVNKPVGTGESSRFAQCHRSYPPPERFQIFTGQAAKPTAVATLKPKRIAQWKNRRTFRENWRIFLVLENLFSDSGHFC